MKKKDENYYIKTINEAQKGRDIDEEELQKHKTKKTINPLKNIQRFWEPCVIYIYGDKATEKSDLYKELFLELYKKDNIKQFENYNNDKINYNRDTTILIDDYYGSMSWTNFLQLTNRNYCLMNIKYERNSSIDIEAFIRRVRYIIKFEGDPIDSRIGKGDITHIFEKGNKQDFNNRIFDIEFNRETTLEQAKKAKKVTVDLGIKGTIFQDTVTEYYYWRQSWENEINKYSTFENIDDITN
ncbi:hypothetical protein C2G38_2188633 [Gigaspora rosea]|uniref:Helicase superfamily 3 single-stranded DNA/RNA virus domain-containing protein n=1 Tax=Gigaspora rosea TaxID=44941 RepID=A0A397V4I8_9GLOM|nr:hypothetical protein C2G38_2188633 [Gigaspora rosea]